MNREIEVGEYVRTETGFIRRIKSIDKTETTEECPVNMYWCNLDKPIKILKECSKDTIYAIEMSDAKKLKHFNNILDLIEDKDIVEIELSEEFVEKKDKDLIKNYFIYNHLSSFMLSTNIMLSFLL
jgi:hypothetical protein